MTSPLPSKTAEPVPQRRRWLRKILMVVLAGIAGLSWHVFTGQRAMRQLREVGFYTDPPDVGLRTRLGRIMRDDWRQLFKASTWEPRESEWTIDPERAGQLLNLDAVAPALRRINPKWLSLHWCMDLQNVDGLRGLRLIEYLNLGNCHALQNLDGLKGLVSLKDLRLAKCESLQNMDGLRGLTSLTHLELRDCTALRNVDVLKGLRSLNDVDLSNCTALEDLNALTGLTALREVQLPRCSALHNLDGLKELKGLQRIFLGGCSKLTPEKVAALSAALPNTIITYP